MNNKTGAKQTFYYAIGTLSMKAISLLMVPLFTYFLTPEEFGTLEVLLTFINLMSIVLCFGLGDALFKFCASQENSNLQKIVCGNANSLSLLISLLLLVPAILLSAKISHLLPANVTTTQVTLVLTALLMGNILGIHYAWLRLNNQALRFIKLSISRALLQALLVLFLLNLGLSVTGVMLATVLSTLAILLFSSIQHYKTSGLSLDRSWQKRLVSYGSPLIFSGIASFITLGLDNWWLAYKIGPAAMAPYALAMKFSMVTIIIIQPFMMWWLPNRFKYTQTLRQKKSNAEITTLGVNLGLLFGIIISSGSILFINVIINPEYHSAIQYVTPLCLVWSIKNAGDLMNYGCYHKSTHSVMIINFVTAFIAVAGYYFFINIFGNWGAVYVLLSAFSIRWLLFLIVSQYLFKLPYHYKKIVFFLMFILVAMLVIITSKNVYHTFCYALMLVLLGCSILFLLHKNEIKKFIKE